MGKEEILAAVKTALTAQAQYGFSVKYDAEGNPIMKVAPIAKFEFAKDQK
ncbi:MAG TPA: hypothetical protein VLV84_03280 [Candidatus Acidoferrales bacterium]|nr:hypothetical protein [Candidatus Acidoferrales bacterium]